MFVRSTLLGILALTFTLTQNLPVHASLISDIQEMFEPAAAPPTDEQIMEKVDVIIDALIVKAETKIWDKYQLYVFGLMAMLGCMVVFLGISLWFNRRNRRRILATLAEVENNRRRIAEMFTEVDANQRKIAALVAELDQLVCKHEPDCSPESTLVVDEKQLSVSKPRSAERTTEAWDIYRATKK